MSTASTMTARVAKCLAWIWAVALLFLTLAPPRFRFVTGASRDLEHFAAFALLGLLFAIAYPDRRLSMALAGIPVIATVEVLQLFMPGRHAYVGDFLLNAAGLCVGMACALLWSSIANRVNR